MGNITWTNTFTTNQTGSIFTKIQQDFANATSVINTNVDGTNISTSAVIAVNSLTANTVSCQSIVNSNLASDMVLTFGAGSPKKLKITDSGNNSLFEVDVSGNITVPLGKTNLYPIGTVIYFTGSWTNNSTLPGWFSCDGNNTTPDLRSLFIMGASTSGQTGGYSDLTLASHSHTGTSGTESATHTHLFSGSFVSGSIGDHTHTIPFGNTLNSGGIPYGGKNTYLGTSTLSLDANTTAHIHTFTIASVADADAHTHTLTINQAGAGEAGVGKNLPAYYTVIPVMRVS